MTKKEFANLTGENPEDMFGNNYKQNLKNPKPRKINLGNNKRAKYNLLYEHLEDILEDICIFGQEDYASRIYSLYYNYLFQEADKTVVKLRRNYPAQHGL